MKQSVDAPTRAGFLTAFIAAALLVFRATVLYGRAGHVAYPGLMILLAAAVTILPATLFAMFMGGLGRAVRLSFDADPADGKPAFTFRSIHALYCGCVLALLSPFIPGLFSEPPPPKPVVVATPTPTPAPKLVFTPPPKPTPPPKIYEKPEGFDSAVATQITVVAQRTLTEVDSAKPIQFSPDGRGIAFYRDSDSARSLTVYDLDTFTEAAHVTFDKAAASLAWSPDSRRIAGMFERGDARAIAVFDVALRRLTFLPQADGEEIPSGLLSWPDADELLVHPGGEKPLALNLDTLELRPLDEAPFFAKLDDAVKERVSVMPLPEFPKTLTWLLDINRTMQVALPRLAKGEFRFKNGDPHVVAADPGRWVRLHIPDIPTPAQARVLCCPDCTKIVVVRDRVATVFYLGLREATKTIRVLDMKRKLEDFPQADALRKALDGKRLGAFIYEPFANPLTDKIIGGDFGKVKATLRFMSWNGTMAEVWIQDEYAPVEASDVVSGLHVAKDGGAVPIGNTGRRAWWMTLGGNGDTRLSLIPSRKDAPLVEFSQTAESKSDAQKNTRTLPPIPSTATRSNPPNPASFQPKQIQPPDSKIVGFINFHHQKSSDRNINAMMDDYGDRIDHYKSGFVDRTFIRAEEEKYHAPGHTVFEKVKGEIRETLVAPDRIRTEYPLQVVLVKPDGSWTRGISDVTLEIQVTPQGLRIVKQNSVTRENEKFKGRGSLPPL